MSDTQWILQLDPSITGVSSDRVMLDLNNGPIEVGTDSTGSAAVDWGDASITTYETQQGQFGNSVADYILPNRTVTINLLLGGTGYEEEEETARSQLQQKVGLLQREGGQLLRQRDGGPAMYADIVNATLTLPDEWGETGDVEPDVILVLETLPDFYGDEITLDTISATGFCDTVLTQGGETAVIAGDYPARCRLRVTSTESATHGLDIVWGFRSRYYTSASTATLLVAASTVYGGGATVTTLSGSYYTNVAQTAASETMRTLVATSAQKTYIGSYRVLARVYSSVAGAALTLYWGPGVETSPNDAVTIQAADEWTIVDLGPLLISPSPVGTPVCTLFVYTSSDAQISMDYLMFVPLDDGSGEIAGSAGTGADVNVFNEGFVTEVRYDGSFVTISSGGAVTPAPIAIGDLTRLPVSGLEEREVEFLMKLTSGFINGAATPNPDSAVVSDATQVTFTVQPIYRPCWLSRP